MKNLEHCYNKNFQYRHQNPYHHKLKIFDDFVLRDNEGEDLAGQWKSRCFKNQAPIEVEVGTGYGHFMHQYCQDNPTINFVGLDYRFKRSFNLAQKLSKIPNKNFRYLRARGERIQFLFAENEVSKVYYFFPDPWPKTRHHKKRLFQKPFLDMCLKVLKPGGQLIVKTDHDEYFDWMIQHWNSYQKDNKQSKSFQQTFLSYDLHEEKNAPKVLTHYKTKFEKIFLKKRIKIKALTLEVKRPL